MILRMWKGRSAPQRAAEYAQHAARKVFPALRTIKGFHWAYLLRRTHDEATEFVVITLWDSMTAVRRFAGAKPEKAVVEWQARSMLSGFDEFVDHFEVVHTTEGGTK